MDGNGIRAPTEGRVSRISCPKIAGGGGRHNNFSKLLEIKGYEVFRVDSRRLTLPYLSRLRKDRQTAKRLTI
jgi:hypothetical protein